jgi:uncharacterized protein (DUF697 family)/GTP-binding protein EngB required for normal cell division
MKEYSIDSVNHEVRRMVQEQKVPNILICGQTGVGKSSIVNFIFNDDVAATGTGEPCTKDITLYKNAAINIYDSEGYEIGGNKQARYESMIFDDFLLKRKGAANGEAVHLVWYAVSGARKRYTDLDIALIRRIRAEGYPVCVLLTKVDELNEEQFREMKNGLIKELVGIDVFSLSIFSRNNPALAAFCDWEKLTSWSYNKLPDVFKDRFVSSLRAGLEEKHKQAGIAIGVAAAAATTVGASPIPFSDAALLVPIQTGLVLRIVTLYGIKLQEGAISSIAGSALMTNLGKAAAGGLLKLIPGIGTIVGAVINAAVAGGLTTALGVALSELCYRYCKDQLDGKPVSFNLEAVLSSSEFLNSVTAAYKEQKANK